MLYSQGVAPYYDISSGPEDSPDPAAAFLLHYVVKGSTVLDIGAGTGTTAFALAEHAVYVTALEPDSGMYAALLVRLLCRPDLHARVTPVPGAAGLLTKPEFDFCTCFSVMHLLDKAQQESVAMQARTSLRPGGKAIIGFPVVSNHRQPRQWSVSANKTLGRLRVEHSSATEVASTGWKTHWRFASYLDEELIAEVVRVFDWEPLAHERTEELIQLSGLTIEESFSGYDRSPYRLGESLTRLVVASVA